jgi:hypothetical protein
MKKYMMALVIGSAFGMSTVVAYASDHKKDEKHDKDGKHDKDDKKHDDKAHK